MFEILSKAHKIEQRAMMSDFVYDQWHFCCQMSQPTKIVGVATFSSVTAYKFASLMRGFVTALCGTLIILGIQLC